jgi:hypothetical protein
MSMSTSVLTKRMAEVSPRLKARVAGVFYLLAVLTGVLVEFVVRGRLGFAPILIPVSCYIAATLVLYDIFEAVDRRLSLLAALFSIVVSTLGPLEWHPRGLDIGLMALGCYCLLMGYLIFKSTFLPRILGVLMALAGVAWLTMLSEPLANYLSPYNLAGGILGQLALILWLLLMGVDAAQWQEKTGDRRR